MLAFPRILRSVWSSYVASDNSLLEDVEEHRSRIVHSALFLGPYQLDYVVRLKIFNSEP